MIILYLTRKSVLKYIYYENKHILKICEKNMNINCLHKKIHLKILHFKIKNLN